MAKKKKQVEKELQFGRNKILIILGIFAVLFLTCSLAADEITHKFKSPSFSGQNTSAHYLTIEQQEYSRAEQLRKDLLALAEQKKRDEENSVIKSLPEELRITHIRSDKQTDSRQSVRRKSKREWDIHIIRQHHYLHKRW